MWAEKDLKMHFLMKICTQILSLLFKKSLSKLLSLNQNTDVVRWFIFGEDPHSSFGYIFC